MFLFRFLTWLGQWIAEHPWRVLLAWFALVMVLKVQSPDWEQVAMDGDLQHLPEQTTTVRGTRLNSAAFPDEKAKSQLVLVFARRDQKLSVADRELALRTAHQFESRGDSALLDVWTEKTPVIGAHLASSSGQAMRVVVRSTNDFMATDNIRLLAQAHEIVEQAQSESEPGLQIGITGSAAIGGDMLSAAAESVASTHRTTILLVTAVLILIYRSPWLVLIPLLTIGVAASCALDFLALLAQWSLEDTTHWPIIRIFTTTKIFVIVLLFGAGTDYCLFLTARFRELRSQGVEQAEAVRSALGNVGVALLASALTTIVGLAMMGWAEFGKFTYSGPAIAICLAVTLFACLTLVPALLATPLGTRVAAQRDQGDNPFWRGVAEAILSRPRALLAACLIVMLPFAVAGWHVDITYDLLGELPKQRLSRQGTQLLREHFPPGEIGPLVVLAEHPQGELDSVDGQFTIAELAKALNELPGVAQVRSLYRPLGGPAGSVRLFSSEGIQALAARGSPVTKAAFVSQAGPYQGKVTRLFVILKAEPFSSEAVQICSQVEQTVVALRRNPDSGWYQAEFELLGPTAGIRDLELVTTADRKRIEVLVTAAVLLVILGLLRKPVICFYLIVTVVSSYLVTLGLADWTFGLLRGEDYVGLDWKVPIFLFVILVAVGQDYNIYLVSRVLEEQGRLGLREGLRRAVVQTGGIITSCGVIMAGTFVSLLTAQMHGMVEMGFALSLGILLDTLIVRTLLVPAFLAMQLSDSEGD